MELTGSVPLETERLVLKAQTMAEQKRLWEILMTKGVYDYYLSSPKHLKDKIQKWWIQEQYYRIKMQYANEPTTFEWSIFLKENNECIGKIGLRLGKVEQDITDIDWYLEPSYQRLGLTYEAAKKVLDYMFESVGISEIKTDVAKINAPSWHVLEKLGFERIGEKLLDYTFQENRIEGFTYSLTKERYLGIGRK